MHANKSFNRNPTNHRLYHALMEALIEDENAIDKGVADTGKKKKRRRTKESESSKKPSTTKETPKEPNAKVVMDDAGKDVVRYNDQPQDTSEPKTAKTLNPEWFTQPPRPPTPILEWYKCQVVLDQPEQPLFNQMVSPTKDPLTFNDLMATPIDFSNTASTQVSTANLSDDTVYAFLASQPNGSQLVYEDLKQIHEDDTEEIDLKWQLALLSMRIRRGPRNQDNRNMNQDSSRRTVNVEETSSKAMLAIDGAGFD
ncbi:hypothetical protein Tco_1427165 [Tanacetum coccineum]